jgi:hypothetical protein
VLGLATQQQQDTVDGHPILPVQQPVVGQQVEVFLGVGTGLGVQMDHFLERLAQPKDEVGGRRHGRQVHVEQAHR